MLLQVSPRKYGTKSKRDRFLAKWKKEYTTIMETKLTEHNYLTSRGRGNGLASFVQLKPNGYPYDETDQMVDEFGEDADRVIEELKAGTKASRLALAARFRFAAKAMEMCVDLKIHPAAMIGRLNGEAWGIESEEGHFRRCEDPECCAVICRKSRGLNPLTMKQLRASKRRAKVHD